MLHITLELQSHQLLSYFILSLILCVFLATLFNITRKYQQFTSHYSAIFILYLIVHPIHSFYHFVRSIAISI